MMIVVALAGCRGEKATLTGGYGNNVVSGDVVMANGASPAGVEVSVRGTGMTTTLSADGRFAFVSVPEAADLDFRASNGINGTLRLEQNETSLHVELGPNGAKKSSRRRAARGGERVYEFEGLVVSATDTEVKVFTSHQVEVTIGLTADTIIRHGQTPLTAADLLPDTRVHVKAKKNADETYTAILVIVQQQVDDGEGGEGEQARKEYEGTVVSAAADQLVIFDSHKQEVTFVINADTVIRKGNTPIAAEDIQAGWRVHVRASTATDGTKTAELVIIQNNKG